MDDDDDDNTAGGGGGADDDLLSSLMSRLPSISSSQELVQTFASICNIDNGLAQFFIDSSGGNLPVAINLFYEYGATAGGGGGGGGGGRRRPIASHGGAGGGGGGGSVSQLDASLASFLGVGAAPSSFSSMPASDGAFGGYSGVVAGGGEEEDEDEGGDKAMQMAIALSSGIAVSDIDQMRAIEAQNAALFRAEQARASNPFAAYGFAPAQQAALAAPAAASTGAMVIGSASSSSSASSNSAAFAMQGSSSNSGGDMDDS